MATKSWNDVPHALQRGMLENPCRKHAMAKGTAEQKSLGPHTRKLESLTKQILWENSNKGENKKAKIAVEDDPPSQFLVIATGQVPSG